MENYSLSNQVATKLQISRSQLAALLNCRVEIVDTKDRELTILNNFIDLMGEFGVRGSLILNILNDDVGAEGESLLWLLLS